MKPYTLGLYEKSMPDTLSFREKLQCAADAGFDALEMSIDESDARLERLQWSAAERAALLSVTREVGTYINTICLSGHRKYPLGSNDPETAARSMEIMEDAINLAYDLGVHIIQLAGYDVYYEPSDEDTKKRFAQNLAQSVEMAATRGIILAMETMENDFMNTIEKAMVYVRQIQSPYLKVYPDIGNVTNATNDVIGDIRSGAGHIAAAHLKETAPGVYRNMRFGEGHVDFAAATAALKRQGVHMYTAEFWYLGNDDWRDELRRAHDYLRPYLQ